MKLVGEFVVRQVMDTTVAIPVGETALRLNSMILLNDVSRVIWNGLAHHCQLTELVDAVTQAFEVDPDQAQADIQEFLDKLRELELLEE